MAPAQHLVRERRPVRPVRPGDAEVGRVADDDLRALHDHQAVDGPGVVGGPRPAPAQGLDLEPFDPVRQLDEPAFERRTPAHDAPPPPRPPVSLDDDTPIATPARRFPAGDLERRERIRKDNSDTPAFLRRMMD